MKCYQQLSNEERLYIEHSLRAGKKQNQIAQELQRHPSTISREIRRNMFARSYLYTHHWACYISKWRKRSKLRALSEKNLKMKGCLVEQVRELLQKYLSPQQISEYLKRHHKIKISHETIYRYIHEESQRKEKLKGFLRHGRKKRRKAYGSGARVSKIPNRVGIANRPRIVESKQRIGDWECDTIIGGDRKAALVSIVERKSLFTLIAVVQRKTAEEVSKALIKLLQPYASKVKTLTFDNGSEFMLHEKVAKALSAKTYFANPYASWERGINENTNGLIRQFFPKGTNFNHICYQEIKNVLFLINNRPRKTRKNKSPNELFNHQFVPLLSG